MSCKLPGVNAGAVGYWGRDPSTRVDLELIPEKIKTLLIDKLITRGKDVFLWQPVEVSAPNVIGCSCFKDTTKRPDITCSSCYGVQLIPGYVKFAHQTLFVASVSPGLVLTGTKLDTNIKPNRIILDTGLTGTIVTANVAYTNPNGYDWEYKLDAPNIKSTSTVAVEFSTDSGTTWNPIANINNILLKPVGSGNIKLRITLTRVAITDRSAEFEIIRLRHKKVAQPYIKILRPQVTEVPSWVQYGNRMEHAGEKFWTTTLDYFDPSIIPDTPAARIIENSFYARINGINVGNRYVTTKLSYSEEMNIFTHQSFDVRLAQPEEVYHRLVF